MCDPVGNKLLLGQGGRGIESPRACNFYAVLIRKKLNGPAAGWVCADLQKVKNWANKASDRKNLSRSRALYLALSEMVASLALRSTVMGRPVSAVKRNSGEETWGAWVQSQDNFVTWLHCYHNVIAQITLLAQDANYLK